MKEELALHDATFDGIIKRPAATTLYFTRSDGFGSLVELEGVDALQLEDFRQGNIVVIFEVTSGEEPNPHIKWERLYPAPHPSANEEHHARHGSFLKSKISAIASGELTLVEMQPAYGADLLAVCRSANLLRAS